MESAQTSALGCGLWAIRPNEVQLTSASTTPARYRDRREPSSKPKAQSPEPLLPADRALLAGIHILRRACAEKECLHVLRQETSRLRIHHVETVVVDQHRLLTHPLSPAFLTDLTDDSRADRSRKRCSLESGAGLPATNARYIRNGRIPPWPGEGPAACGCKANRCRTRTTWP
jgi:hypothetical protein